MLEVTDVVRAAGSAILEDDRWLPSQRRTLRDILACRTPALGGEVYLCDKCGKFRHSYHSCQNRHCPKCQGSRSQKWLEQRRRRFLDTEHYLVTFTLPQELRPLAWAHQREVYSALMRAAAQAILSLAADPKWIGAQPGVIAVLHTWTRAMLYHPHGHFLVTGGGWDALAQCWRKTRRSGFLVSGRVLSATFKGKLYAELQRTGLLAEAPRDVWKRKWVAHCKHAGHGVEVLDYLARYIYRIAIANSRIEHVDQEQVRFRYRNNKTGRVENCTLTPRDFLRRFLMHVLPRGFTKVRYFGLYAPAAGVKLEHARETLAAARVAMETGPPASAAMTTPAPALQIGSEDDLGSSSSVGRERRCPACETGTLRLVGDLPRLSARGPP